MPADPLLVVRNLSKIYPGRGKSAPRQALRGVSFHVERATTLGIVGPSGSGKSTLAKCLAGYETPTSGEIRFSGPPFSMLMIPQQPADSLNPRFTAKEIVEEPLVIQRRPVRDAAERALALAGLPSSVLSRRAHHFSGGERQRLAIARALVLEPELLILDESFAGLDAALQQHMGALLRDLQQRLGVAYLLIAHDLELVADLAGEIAVMHDGAIVEQLPSAALPSAQHPVTRELVSAASALSIGGPTA